MMKAAIVAFLLFSVPASAAEQVSEEVSTSELTSLLKAWSKSAKAAPAGDPAAQMMLLPEFGGKRSQAFCAALAQKGNQESLRGMVQPLMKALRCPESE